MTRQRRAHHPVLLLVLFQAMLQAESASERTILVRRAARLRLGGMMLRDAALCALASALRTKVRAARADRGRPAVAAGARQASGRAL